jgi:hypothetical protein
MITASELEIPPPLAPKAMLFANVPLERVMIEPPERFRAPVPRELDPPKFIFPPVNDTAPLNPELFPPKVELPLTVKAPFPVNGTL